MNIQQQIEQMLANASAPVTPGTGQQKQQTVANAAAQKKAALGGFDPYAATVGAQEGTGYASATQQERDFRDMSTTDLWRTYGDAAVFQRAGANSGVAADQQAARDWGQAAADTVSGVGLGAFNGLAGIGALGAGVVSSDLGNSMSRGIESVNEVVLENQSPALQARRRLNQAMNVNDQRDSTQQYEQDIANGRSGFMAGAARIARDAGSAIANAAADPMTLMDGTAQAVGSVIGVGPLTRIGGAVGRKLLDKGMSSGVLTKENAQLLAKLGEQGGTATLIGGMEAGGAFQQSVNEVLAMPFDKLAANSVEFNKLVDSGMSMAEAREVLANKVGLETAAKVAPAAVAMGKFVAKFEAAPMTTASMKSGLANIGTQALEEAGQGGVSQMATNAAIQSTADETRTISEGVGAQMGTGALFGGLMAGGLQAPGMAAKAASKAVSQAAQAAQGLRKTPAQETEPTVAEPATAPRVSALVPMTTDLAENAKAATQVSDAQEQLNIAATESIQNNPTLDDETKVAQLNGLAMLEATFTYGEQDKQDIAQRMLPADLTSKLSTARNMPEAFVALTDHVIGMTDAVAQGAKPTAEFIQAVSYLNELSDRVEGLASIPEISAIMDGLQEGTPESDYLAGIYQAMANIEGSQQVVAMQDAVRERMAQAPILEQVSLDNIPEVHARAKYAPQTLAQNVIEDTLAMADAGQIELSEAQRVRLMASQALVAAMAQGNVTDAVNAVSRQIAFNEGSEGGFKYPSLVEHTGTITKAVISGDLERAKNDMMHLRNFAQTMANKAAAINESAGTNKKVSYQNWIPRKNEWRQSATGLNADLKGEKSTAFAQRIYTEALLAQATYENMVAHFPALAEGMDALTGVPEMSMALQNAMRKYSTAPAALAAPVVNQPTPTPTPTPSPEKSGAQSKLNVWAGTNENRELSNLAPRTFTIKGREYFSVEHAYQSLKSGNFDQATYDKYDRKGYKKITGNKGTKTEDGWNIRLMASLVWESFAQNPDAAKKLLATGDQEITHTQDRGIWAKEFPRILMSVRERLQTKTNPASLEETFKGLLNEVEALEKMMFDVNLNASPTAYKLMADLEDAMTSLVEHTRTSYAQGLLEYIKNYIANVAEEGKGRSWDVYDFHGLVLRAQYHLKEFTAQTAELSEESSAPPTTKSRITEEQVARLSDAGLNARIEAIQVKREKGEATPEDQATFAVLDAEMTKRENAAVIAQKKKSPGVAAISKLDDAELNSRIRFIEQNNKPDALEKNSVYQALVAERSARNERANAAKSEPNTQVSKELALVNALAAKLKLPAVTAVREAAPEDGLQGAMYTYATGVITVDPRLKGNARLSIILHELGHHVVSQALAQELSVKPEDVGRMGQDELLAAMKKAVPEVAAEYESWLAARGDVTTMGRYGVRVPISQSAMSRAVYSFITKGGAEVNELFGKKKRGVERTRNSTLHEWLADNIAKALESNEDTRGVIAQFFKRIATAFKKMYEALAPDSSFLAAKSVQDWLVALANKAQEIREPEAQDTVVTPEVEVAEVATTSSTDQKSVLDGLDALMPDLDGRPNVLKASFEPGSNPKSRIASMAEPISQVLKELSDGNIAEQIIGKKVSPEKRKAAMQYVQNVVKTLAEQTANRIDLTMMRKAKSGTRGTWLAMAAIGQVPPDHPDRAKAFQLLPNGGGALAAVMNYAQFPDGSPGALVNPRLVESAALAAGQWYLSSGNSGIKKLDEGTVSSISGVPRDMVNDHLISLVSQGLGYRDAIRGIADAITQAWNLRLKDDAPIAKAEAVINSLAAELFYTMVHGDKGKSNLSQKFFERVDILVDKTSGNVLEVTRDSTKLLTQKIEDNQQLISRYLPRKAPEGQESISTVLPNLLGVPVDDVIYFVPAEIEVSDTQQHSSVPLSAAERKAQERQQQTGFTLNTPFMKIHSLFTDKDMIDLLGTPVDASMNVATRESAEGKNTTVIGGWNQVKNVVAQVTAEAEARGVAPDELPIYYRFESISTARSMMRGRYNPQSDKGMRQAFTSMQSVADLTDPEQKLLWDTAALQMTGARVYAMKPEDITPKAEALFAEPEMVVAIDAIAQALQGNKDITGSSLVPLLQAAATKTDDGLTNELIHVLIDRARYNLADEAGRKSFKSRLYIEADGVANGPAGAIAMMTAADSPSELGAFIRAAAKTGFFIGDPTMNMNTFRQDEANKADTYATAGEHASDWAGQRLWEREQLIKNPNLPTEQRKSLLQIDVQHRTVLDVMASLMPPNSFKVSTNEQGETQLEISRKVTKNPVTITVYGSGKTGIAGKLAGIMVKEITDRISEAAKNGVDVADAFGGQEAFNRLMDQLQRLTVNVPGYKEGKLAYVWNPNSKKNAYRNLQKLRNKENLQSFKFSPVEYTSLVSNLTEFFVNELNTGIKSALGSSVLNNSELMVQASNYQSLAAIHLYNTEMQKLIDAKKAANPAWDYVLDGFSKNDLKALRQKIKTVAPILRTAVQAWDTNSSARTASEHVAGSTLDGMYPVEHLQRTPTMSGVKVAPYLVIGMGDAAMVTNLLNDMDLPEGAMQVYDGINLPFIKAREGGVVANKAIAEAWLENNPLRTLLESFEAVAKSVDMDAARDTFAKSDPVQAARLNKGPSPEMVLDQLREGAARIDALHAAIREVGFSIDQMAATGATHAVEGTASAENAEAMLVEAYTKHLGTPITLDARKDVESWLSTVPADSAGNKVIDSEGLRVLAASGSFAPHHREMVRRILAVHADRLKDLQVVIATGDSDLSRYLSPAREAALKSGAAKGYWFEDSKTLVLGVVSDSSTIAHELTHAATYQILRQHFEKGLPDTKWGTAVGMSIENLSTLLFEFYERGATDKQLNAAAAKRMAGFRQAMANLLNTDATEPGSTIAAMWDSASQSQRAQAVAEFIAHVSTDDALRSLAKSTLVKRIKDSVIRFLRMVVLGPLGLNNKGPLSDDILSQMQFNVEVISAAQADMARRGMADLVVTAQNPLAQTNLLPNDAQAARIAGAFDQRVGRYLSTSPTIFEAIGRSTEALNATTMAGDLATDAAAAGFLQTPAQRLAFTKMVATLSTQAKIAPAFAQAGHKLYVQALEALDGKLTKDQGDFIRGRTGLRVDSFDRSSLVPSFVALGLVDPVMRNALAAVDKESRTKVEGNIDKRLEALGNNALAAIQDALTGANRSKNVEEALANMAETVAKQAHIEQNLTTRLESATMGVMGKANDWVANTLADKSQALSKAASVKAGKTKSKTMKAAAQTTALVANVFSDAGAAANAEAALSMVNRGKSDFLRGLVKDLTGRVESNALVYDLIKQVGQRVSKARQFYREQLPSVIAKAFSKVPTEEQSTTMFKTMAKTDLASLVQGDNFAAVFDMALDDAKRAAEIVRIEGELKKQTPRTEGRIRKKAKLLAEYMTTGVVQAGLLRNADAVANLLDDNVSGLVASGLEQSKAVVALVDQLITLYALDKMPVQQLEAMRQLRAAEPEGTERVLGVLKHQMDADRARHTGAARFNAWKGYISSDGVAGGSLVVRDVRDEKNLLRQGYRKVADYKGTSLFKTAHMAYYYTPVGKAPFNQGIIQNARMTAGGVDQSTGFAVGFPTAGRITQKATVERLARNAHLDSSREALLAVYDEEGSVIAFERSIDPDQLERLKPSTNILAMLGQWMGRQAEEEMAQAVNFDAVAKAHEMWVTGKHRKGEFVNVLDTKSIGNDPVLLDALRILPNDVIKHAESLFGTGQFMVRKDMLNDVFGYRDASIGDAWTGNSRWSPKTQERVRKLAETYLGEDAFRLLVQGEERWKNLVKDAKTLIVVKSVIVPAANFVANIFQMLARGVPLTAITRGLRDKTLEVDFYVKTHVEQMDLAVQLMALGKKDTNQRQKLEARIQAIEDSWKRLSIWPLLAAGEFGSISDAGIGRDEILLSEGKLQAYIEAKTEKLPPALQRAGKWALITKDTALFQGLQKSMEYGDFLAKAIMYENHLAKGKTKAEALGEITDEFVNYDRHPGRIRGYVEDLGLAWFYNYKLRIAKTAFNMLRKDPLRVALLAGMGLPGMELPVTENVFTKAMEGTLGHSIGPGMLISAPGLNPWVAAMQ